MPIFMRLNLRLTKLDIMFQTNLLPSWGNKRLELWEKVQIGELAP